MAPLIGDAVRSCRADVLLVSLGLIDLGFYTNAEQTADNVRAFVAEARAARPRIRTAVLPVIRNIRVEADPTFADQVAHFNELLAKTAADLDDPTSPSSWSRPHRRTTSTRTPTTARTPTKQANTRSRRRSRRRCGGSGTWAGRTRRRRDRGRGICAQPRVLLTVRIVVPRGRSRPWAAGEERHDDRP